MTFRSDLNWAAIVELRERVELAACYPYLCEAYDRTLPPHETYTLSLRNAIDRKRDFTRIANGQYLPRASVQDWNHGYRYEQLRAVAIDSRFLPLFGRVGDVEETLRGPVDALGRCVWFEPAQGIFRHRLAAAVPVPQGFLFRDDGV